MQHRRTKGQQGPPWFGNGPDPGKILDIATHGLSAKFQRLLRDNLVIMHHIERITDRGHMQLAKSAPCATHRIEGLAVHFGELFGFGQQFARNARGLLDRAVRFILKTQAPECIGRALAQFAALDRNHLKAAASQIPNNTARVDHGGNNAER